jgi:hypothetical protein
MIAHLFLKRLSGCRAVNEFLWLFTLSQCLGVDRGTETTTVMNISVEFHR